MTVYVGTVKTCTPCGRRTDIWAPLTADSSAESAEFAVRLKLRRPPGVDDGSQLVPLEYITSRQRERGLVLGAQPVTSAQISDLLTAAIRCAKAG